jgi:hypothetical protein
MPPHRLLLLLLLHPRTAPPPPRLRLRVLARGRRAAPAHALRRRRVRARARRGGGATRVPGRRWQLWLRRRARGNESDTSPRTTCGSSSTGAPVLPQPVLLFSPRAAGFHLGFYFTASLATLLPPKVPSRDDPDDAAGGGAARGWPAHRLEGGGGEVGHGNHLRLRVPDALAPLRLSSRRQRERRRR